MPVNLLFRSDDPEVHTEVSVYLNVDDFLCINIHSLNDGWEDQFVLLDKRNAIKFDKELRKQISQMEDQSE